MRHHTRVLNLEASSEIAGWSRSRTIEELPAANLKDVQVYVLGVDGAGEDIRLLVWIAPILERLLRANRSASHGIFRSPRIGTLGFTIVSPT